MLIPQRVSRSAVGRAGRKCPAPDGRCLCNLTQHGETYQVNSVWAWNSGRPATEQSPLAVHPLVQASYHVEQAAPHLGCGGVAWATPDAVRHQLEQGTLHPRARGCEPILWRAWGSARPSQRAQSGGVAWVLGVPARALRDVLFPRVTEHLSGGPRSQRAGGVGVQAPGNGGLTAWHNACSLSPGSVCRLAPAHVSQT